MPAVMPDVPIAEAETMPAVVPEVSIDVPEAEAEAEADIKTPPQDCMVSHRLRPHC